MKNVSYNRVQTNIKVFYQIAQGAFLSMQNDLDSSKKPKPNNEAGWIITYDPDRKSFKNALIAIVFCGVYLESLLHLLIVEHKGVDASKKYDGKLYEDKLKLLGCNDQTILDDAARYRKIRKEVVHEKAHLHTNGIRIAQKEAAFAMELLRKVNTYFEVL